METDLTLYSNAKNAIAEYKTVDEVKNFRDKAVALEAYAKQANDYELEHDAAIARVRSERKCGELLRDMEMAKGNLKQGVNLPRSYDTTTGKTLSEMGITKDQSSKWQKLAEVPEKEFESAVSIPGAKPSTNHILRDNKPVESGERMSVDALWWWGRLNDMSHGKMNKSLNEHVNEMTDAMRADAISIIPKLKQWVNDYE